MNQAIAFSGADHESACPCLQRVLVAYLVYHMMVVDQCCLGEGLCNATLPLTPFAAESQVHGP